MKIPNLLEIKTALMEGTKEGHSAGNLFSALEDRQQAATYMEENPEACANLKEQAEQILKEPMKPLRYSLFRAFDKSGKRKGYENIYFAYRKRLKVLALASYLYQEECFYRELQDTIWEICSEYTWCLPAHLGRETLKTDTDRAHAYVKDGKLLPYAYSYRNRLDLFACESAKELAETLRMTGDMLDEEVKDRVVTEILNRVLEQYITFNKIHGFETDLSNWASVCGGSVGIAALYLTDAEELLAPVIQRVISDLDVFLSSYGEDGIGREGVEYWDFGFSNFVIFADLLKERTGGRLNLFEDEKVKKIAFFPARAYLFRDSCVNFSDCEDSCEISRAVLSYLKEIYPEMPSVTLFSVPERFDAQKELSIRDIFWTKKIPAESFTERSEYFEDTEWLVSCQNTALGARSFVIKGGTNNEPHNHNDLGHFLLMLDSQAFLCDLGRGLYTKEYFGEGRYQYLVNASRGHSVALINGQEQMEGGTCDILRVERTEEKDLISMDLVGAYACEGLKKYVRTAEVEKKSERIRLWDCFEKAQGDYEIRERFVSKIQPEIIDGTVVLKSGEVLMRITCQNPSALIQIDSEEYDGFYENTTEKAYLIDFVINSREMQEEVAFTFVFEPREQ